MWTLVLSSLVALSSWSEAYEKVICEGDTSDIRCAPDEKIMIKKATFGRLDRRTCSRLGAINSVTCSMDFKDFAVQKCTGLSSCDLAANTNTFQDPCPGTSKYIHIVYECKGRPARICEGSSVNFKCLFGGRMTIDNAIYGRVESDSCAVPGGNNMNTNCYAPDTNTRVREMCNGKNKCFIGNVENSLFGGDPCPGTYKYLDLFYTCT